MIEIKPEFMAERQRKLVHDFNLQRREKNLNFKRQINEELQNKFFGLSETHARNIYKNEKYSFDCCAPSRSSQDGAANVNSMQEGRNEHLFSPTSLASRTESMDYSFSPF